MNPDWCDRELENSIRGEWESCRSRLYSWNERGGVPSPVASSMPLGSHHWVFCLERGRKALPSKKKKKMCVYFAVLMVIQRAWRLRTRQALFFQTMPLHLHKKKMFFLGHSRLVFCIWPLGHQSESRFSPGCKAGQLLLGTGSAREVWGPKLLSQGDVTHRTPP